MPGWHQAPTKTKAPAFGRLRSLLAKWWRRIRRS